MSSAASEGKRSRLAAIPSRQTVVTLFHEGWKYFAVSAGSLLVDLGLFWTEIHLLHIHYLIANLVSVSVGMLINYWASVTWVFGERSLASRRAEFLGFVAIGLAGLAVNEAGVALFVGLIGLAPVAGKLAAAGLSFLFNFVSRRWLLFTDRG